ncbi:hypothetical protein [Pannonibacter sp. SL95]|uniref:hypothetical protein n=1 Tax=Pannonibacter sp. SL95 TaxID=2995153 RepID=UPI0022756F93|nr:hypothetical protein [Pannonibacter sp. SL95]MCY1704556.1 hypothetical protein [Pannonibacter sp. SL95]
MVRDDLLPGGTKARIFRSLMEASPATEFVYAGPAFGAAQVALAAVAYQMCRQATLFVPARKTRTRYTIEAESYGARIIEVRPGYLSNVRCRAEAWAAERGAMMVPFGGGCRTEAITEAAQSLPIEPDEVWCAGGSGTLARALKVAWPEAQLHVVRVGRELPHIQGATVHETGHPFERAVKPDAPFPTHPNYEAKAWEIMQGAQPSGQRLFWNVYG